MVGAMQAAAVLRAVDEHFVLTSATPGTQLQQPTQKSIVQEARHKRCASAADDDAAAAADSAAAAATAAAAASAAGANVS